MTESYVYAISDGENIKIGVARHPAKRLKTLATGNSNKLTMLGYFSGGFKLEKEIHNSNKKIRDNGEWLESSESLIEYLNSMISDRFIVKQHGKIYSYLKMENLE